MSPDVSFALQLCLEEAVAVVIMYGATDGELKIAIELERLGGTLVARIEDNGQPFDPTQMAPHALPSTLKDAKIGDLGIHLVRSFVSRMDHERCHGRKSLDPAIRRANGTVTIVRDCLDAGSLPIRTVPSAGPPA